MSTIAALLLWLLTGPGESMEAELREHKCLVQACAALGG